MKWIIRYIISLLPLSLMGGGIMLSEWIFRTLHCTTNGKEFNPCFVLGFDSSSILFVGMYWFKYLLPVVWFISVPWFIYVMIAHVEFIIQRWHRA
jgi:hypothetical protein